MKKLTAIILTAILLLALSLPAMAVESPEIVMQPQNRQFPEYSTATYSVKAVGENLSAYWYIEFEEQTYCLSDNHNGIEPWEGFAGESYGGYSEDDTFSWFFGGIEAGLNGAKIWCVIEDGHNDVRSDIAIITVCDGAMPPEIIDFPASVTATVGDEAGVRCLAKSSDDSQLSYTWYETSTGKLQDIKALEGEDGGDFLKIDTQKPGTRFFVCGIFSSSGGITYSSVLPVTVKAASSEAPDDTSEPTEGADGTIGAITSPDSSDKEGITDPEVQVGRGAITVSGLILIIGIIAAVVVTLLLVAAIIALIIILIVIAVKRKKKQLNASDNLSAQEKSEEV